MEVLTPVGHLTALEFIDFLLEIIEYGVHALRRAPDPLKCLTFPLVGLLQGGSVNVPHQCFGLAQNLQCFRQHRHDKYNEGNKIRKKRERRHMTYGCGCIVNFYRSVDAMAFEQKNT